MLTTKLVTQFCSNIALSTLCFIETYKEEFTEQVDQSSSDWLSFMIRAATVPTVFLIIRLIWINKSNAKEVFGIIKKVASIR